MVLRMNAARSPRAASMASNVDDPTRRMHVKNRVAGVASDVDYPTRRMRAKKNWARLPKEP